MALVGNAAQTLHPIAGQGFNLGLRDVMSRQRLCLRRGMSKKIAARIRCSAIIRSDAGPIKKRLSASPMAVHLFANRWAPLVAGRNLGLMAMELFIPARDVLAQRTLGWVAR